MRAEGRGIALVVATVTLVTLVATVLTGCSGKETGATSTTTGTAPPVQTTTTTEPPLEAGKQVYVYTPVVGDCFDRRKVPGQNNKQTDVVLMLACDLPHQNEVFAVVEYPLPDRKGTTGTTDAEGKTGMEWPKDEALRSFGKIECPKQYAAYVGQAYEVSKFDIGYVIPPEANWPSNHVVGCTVFNSSGAKLDASVKDSKS